MPKWERRGRSGPGAGRDVRGASSITASNELRAATRVDHQKVDDLFARFDLSKPEDYRMFLSAMAAAHRPVEDALDRAGAGRVLDDWPARKRGELLGCDMADMGAAVLKPLSAPAFPDTASVLGGLYVIEGSRLGGKVLKRSLSAGMPARFLGADAQPGSWRALLRVIDERVTTHEDNAAAQSAARVVFALFEQAATCQAETRLPRG